MISSKKKALAVESSGHFHRSHPHASRGPTCSPPKPPAEARGWFLYLGGFNQAPEASGRCGKIWNIPSDKGLNDVK